MKKKAKQNNFNAKVNPNEINHCNSNSASVNTPRGNNILTTLLLLFIGEHFREVSKFASGVLISNPTFANTFMELFILGVLAATIYFFQKH